MQWLLQKSAAWCKRPALVDEKEQPPACRCELCTRATAFLASPQGVECLGAACRDPEILGRLSLCSWTQLQTLQSADFLARRAADVGIQLEAPVRLEQLAFAVAVAPLCNPFENHIYFSYGGGSKLQGPALPFLAKAAALARRFPRVMVHIDAHAGVRAPGRLVAKRTSQARAKAVMNELLAQGLPEKQISFTAWGRLVSTAWPEDERVARAEVYFQLDGVIHPQRPEYYNGRWMQGAAQTPDSDDEMSQRLRHADPDSLMLFVPATTGFQLVSILTTA